ncbi:hypothetical protein DFO54_105166 [Erwinia sp. AG740]|nr:hypothetical protein DFO54_105166 [Erwinia sp. AG740]
MAKRNRGTLKNYFRQGAMPSAEHFSDLIDSSVNKIEEGFDKTPEHGLKVAALDAHARLMTFYRDSDPSRELWSVGLQPDSDRLQIDRHLSDGQEVMDDTTPLLTLTPEGRMGVNTSAPRHALEVNGVISAPGRAGVQWAETLPADGQWHDITPRLEGCQAFEVVAGVGIRHSGRYALLHAIALNTCAPSGFLFNFFGHKNRINAHHAYYHSRADKLTLRWLRDDTPTHGHDGIRPYRLQIRTHTSYGDGIVIRYHLTQLWHDAYMHDCLLPAQEE